MDACAQGPLDFGWDPVFKPDGFDQTYAEMDTQTKNGISHRALSLAKLCDYLRDNAADITTAVKGK
jgi:inosine triphosphate pyrophosphatase